MGNVRAAYNHGIIDRDNFCQCDRISWHYYMDEHDQGLF